jgi:hypothetical protein
VERFVFFISQERQTQKLSRFVFICCSQCLKFLKNQRWKIIDFLQKEHSGAMQCNHDPLNARCDTPETMKTPQKTPHRGVFEPENLHFSSFVSHLFLDARKPLILQGVGISLYNFLPSFSVVKPLNEAAAAALTNPHYTTRTEPRNIVTRVTTVTRAVTRVTRVTMLRCYTVFLQRLQVGLEQRFANE